MISVVMFVTNVTFVTVCYAMLRFVTKLNEAIIYWIYTPPIYPPNNVPLPSHGEGSRFILNKDNDSS